MDVNADAEGVRAAQLQADGFLRAERVGPREARIPRWHRLKIRISAETLHISTDMLR